MIQIAEPRQIRVESHRGVIDSTAMTKEGLIAPEFDDEYRLAPSDEAVADAALSPLVAPPRAAEVPEFEQAFYEGNAPPLPGSTHPALSPSTIQQLAVQRSARNRQVLMIAVLGLSGVLFAGLLFTAFLYWYSGDRSGSQQAQNQPKDPVTTEGPKREPEPSTEQADAPDLDPLLDPMEESSAATDKTAQADSPDAQSPANPDAENADTNNNLTSAIANAIADAGSNPEQPSAPESDTAAAGDSNAADIAAAPTAELPDQLKKFENILSRSIEPQMIADEVIQKAPPTAEELGLQVGGDAKALPPVDVGTQLQLEVSGLIVPDGTPFSTAVSTWVQVSGIPTGVDLDSFAGAGVDPYATVGIKEATAKTLGDIGKSLASAIDVNLAGFNNQFLVFQASEARVRDLIGSSIKIDDLITNEEQAKWLVATLDQLIMPPADSGESVWKIKDGELVTDPAVVNTLSWFWAVRLLETWRHEAQLESKVDGLDAAKFATKFVDADQLPSLDRPMQFAQIERTTVAQLITAVSAANKWHAWIDWASASQRGLGPNTIDMFVTQQRSLRQVLRDLMNKYGMVVAFEDDRSFIVTTSQEYLAQARLYVLPSNGRTAEQWQTELEPLTPASVDNVQPVRAVLTPDSKFVMVRCCRPRLRN